MTVVNVRFVMPDDLHFNLKRQALDERTTLIALIMKASQEYIERCREETKKEEGEKD